MYIGRAGASGPGVAVTLDKVEQIEEKLPM